MEKPRTQFIFETGGYCCLCLKTTTSSSSSPSPPSKRLEGEPEVISIDDSDEEEEIQVLRRPPQRNQNQQQSLNMLTSFTSICEYLRLDLTKIFDGIADVPMNTLPSMEESELKGDLCWECSKVSVRFSTLYLRLNEIQMQMKTVLESLHKTITADDPDRKTLAQLKSKFRNEPESLQNLEITARLQKQIAERCIQTFRRASPSPAPPPLKPTTPMITINSDSSSSSSASSTSEDEEEETESVAVPPAPMTMEPSPLDSPIPERDHLAKEDDNQDGITASSSSLPLLKTFHNQVCSVCNEDISTSTLSLRQLLMMNHTRPENPMMMMTSTTPFHLQCCYCCKQFSGSARSKYLKRHEKICSVLVCDKCSTFEEDKLTFNCILCSRSFATKLSLLQHNSGAAHKTLEYKYKCNYCPARFKRLTNLKLHNSYACKRKRFRIKKRNPLNLTATNFNCDYCSREFACSKYLKKHYLRNKECRKIRLSEMSYDGIGIGVGAPAYSPTRIIGGAEVILPDNGAAGDDEDNNIAETEYEQPNKQEEVVVEGILDIKFYDESI